MAPLAPIGPIDLEGIIRQATWHPRQNISSAPGKPGINIFKRTFRSIFFGGSTVMMPAHYKLQLDETEVSDQEAYSSLMGYGVMVSHAQDDGFLTVGMHIRIHGLTILGDETGVVSFFDKIEILDSPIEDYTSSSGVSRFSNH
ncbi:MAG: hypothetical protein AAFU78_19450 [Cyanobacteria bacterium J06633_2]